MTAVLIAVGIPTAAALIGYALNPAARFLVKRHRAERRHRS